MPYIKKTITTKHGTFIIKTKCFYYNPANSKKRRTARLAPTPEGKKKRNERQKYLHNKLLHGSPSIYMEIRRGQALPSSPKILKHRRTQNDELAQLAFAGFDFKPFIAKDKKKSLFNREERIKMIEA